MDLTNEPWEVLEPLIPNPVRRADGRGIPWEVPVGSSLENYLGLVRLACIVILPGYW